VNTALKGENRFEKDARRYADYLQTAEGRLRAELTFANLQEFLRPRMGVNPLCVLDLGCGPGGAGIRLAQLGMKVTLFDSSPAMLDIAKKAMSDAGVSDGITLKRGEAAQLAEVIPAKSFDVILCHNVLEYVDSPSQVLSVAVRLLRDASSTLSVLVRNQAGEVLKAAVQAGDLEAAEQNLDAEWVTESLYGGKARLFTPNTLQSKLQAASLRISARRGVRVASDYLPADISRSTNYERIFSLERKLGMREEFFGVARYLHCLCSPAVRS